MKLSQINTNIENLSLQQLLTQQLQCPHNNFYVFALSRSRYQQPCISILYLLNQLIDKDGIKWLQVLHRLVIKNYHLCYNYCLKNIISCRVIIIQAHNYANNQQILQIQSVLHGVISQLKISPNSVLSYITLETYLVYLQFWNKNFPNRTFFIINTLQYHLFQQLEYNAPKIWLKYLKQIVISLKINQSFAVKSMNLLQWLYQHTEIYQYLNYTLNKLIKGLQIIQIQGLILLCELIGLSNLSSQLYKNREQLCHYLIKTIFNSYENDHNINNLINKQQQMINQHYNYDQNDIFITKVYLLHTLISQVNGMLVLFMHKAQEQFIELYCEEKMLFQLCIISQHIKLREQIIQNYVIKLLQQTNFNNIYTLRFIYLLYQVLPEKFFLSMIKHCVDIMKEKQQNSFIFIKTLSIMQQLSEHKSKIVHANIIQIGTYLQQIIQCRPILQLYQLFRIYLQKYPQIAERNNQIIIKITCKHLLQQTYQFWLIQQKISNKVLCITHCLQLCINQIDLTHYFQVEPNLSSVLNLLHQPYKIQYIQELLNILSQLILHQQYITPSLCAILFSMRKIIQNDKGNIYCILPVIHSLCNDQIVKCVSYEYLQLIQYITHIFTEYLSNFITKDYLELYDNEWFDVTIAILQFIQYYEQIYIENDKLLNQFTIVCFDMVNCEGKLLFLLTINHISPIKIFDIIPLIPIIQPFHNQQTIKMIKIMFIDNLLYCYCSNTLQLFLDFYQHYKSNQQVFRHELFTKLPFHHINLKDYIANSIRQLKNKKCIDSEEYLLIRSILL